MSLATPEKIRRLQKKLYVKAKQEPTFRFYQLYDKVYRSDILAHAYDRCRAKHGAPGVDGVSFEQIEEEGLVAWLERLEEDLRDKTYEPSPVRRVMIPKPGGGERPLGIPTIRDRVAQTAAKLILEPIFEADFEDCAYGYRPKRSAQDAVKAAHEAICKGYTDVVDADLSKYFDTIPHGDLMKSVERRISDVHMLGLIRSWLKVPVEERDENGRPRLTGGKRTNRGTPQGGVISPLLANIYMNRFLRTWRERGMDDTFRACIVNYADDFVILTRRRAAEALDWTRWAMTHLGLTLNETKTRLCNARREYFDFLGYTFGPAHFRKDGHWYLAATPSKKAISRLRGGIRETLRTGIVTPWPIVRDRLNRKLQGWSGYFSYGTRTMAYRAVDNFVQTAVRGFLQRRHKVPGRGTRRFSDAVIFGDRGVLRLRWQQLGRPAGAVS
ncbi:MAG: group II intron reverse transcriptase/maturase [Planctomycetota bacterium]|nr:group II intron reverse transcriptase/maturase [Planctomycetota bacterium]